jgi:ABC-type multidrug transport system ATPase subunit/ABC-type multidrug transport system permease subunit
MCVAASLVECISIGILTGWIFFQLDGSQASLRSRWGALYTAAALQNFLVLLFETYRLTCEIDIFDRERAEDVVGVSSFLLSRRLARALIEDIPVPLIYSGIFYLMVGLRREAARFFVFFAVVLLSHYTAVTFAMLAVALFRDFAGASLIVNLNFTLQSLCSGFFIQSDQIPVWVRWMKWTAYTWYANGALVTNEFIGGSIEPEGYLYDCPHPGGTSNPACAPWTGRYVVVLLGFPQHNWIFRPILILLGFTCAFSILAGFIFSCFKQEIRMSRSRSPIETNASTKILAARPPAPLQALGITLRNLSLDFEKVHLLTRKREVVTILEPVRMLFEPGILNAIMGPSGAGKTSLLKLMAQRNSGTHWGRRYHSTGTMLLGNTIPTKSVIRSMVSYVSQTDDNLLPNLTVRETLYFAAQLRLATWISPSDKKKRAESIMHKLGLSHCANTLIGNEFIKGISGGEKRRVSIAVQMLMEPRILLLDEPTASLDSFTASALIDTLHDLAREGCTVVFTIHQPTSDMFHRFGSVLLLGRGGDTAYAGPREEMLPYFTSLGYNCPIDTNPVDFILDLISADDQSSSRELSSKENVRVLIDTWKSRFSNSHEAVNPVEVATLPAQLNAFTRTPMPLFTATMLLLRRSSICLSRSPSAILARTGQVTGFAIILVVFFTPLRKNDTSVQSRVGFMQEVVAVYFIGMLQNVAVFPGEKAVFDAEARDGTYGVEPFLIAYTALEVPFEIFAAVLFGVLMTFIVGLPRSGEVFGVMSFVCFSLVNCGESVGMMSNTLFKSTGFAVSVTSVVLSLGLIMSGVLSTDLPPVLDAVNYISPCKWAVSVMATYTLRNVRFSCSDAKSNADGSCLVENGQDIIRLYNLFDSRLSLLYLAILVMGYRALAYILLKTFKR